MWRSIWQLPTSTTLSPSLVSKMWCIASGAPTAGWRSELQARCRLTVASLMQPQLCVKIIKNWTCLYYYSLLCANLNFQCEWQRNQRNSCIESHHAVKFCFWVPWSKAAVSSNLWLWQSRCHAKTIWEGPQRGQMASPSQIYKEEPLEKAWVIIQPNVPPSITSIIPPLHSEFSLIMW